MSIASEKTRIESARDRIRNHLVSLGVANGSENINQLAPIVETLGLGGDVDLDGHCIVYVDNNVLKKISINAISDVCGTSTLRINGVTIEKKNVVAVFTHDFTDATGIPNNFLYGFSSLLFLTLPPNIVSIGNNFLARCSSFNKRLTLPSSLGSIGDSFMLECSSFKNEQYPLAIPSSVTSIGNAFMQGCSLFNTSISLPTGLTSIGNLFLASCTSFDSNFTLPSGLTTIGDNFFSACMVFNRSITLPSTLRRIGSGFLLQCEKYNQGVTLPSSITSIGDSFMYRCDSYVSTITANCNATVATSSNYMLSTNNANAPCYLKGITISGTYASAWKSRFPNSTSSPYRKLL